MYLLEGETLTMEELLYGLMLPSGNDAAECIAAYCGGSGGRSRDLCAGLQELICVALFADGADVGQARDLVAVFIELGKQGAGCGGFAFKFRLVGFIGEEDVADVYLIADVLLPLANDARFDCNAFLGHQYAFCHKCFTPILFQ